MLYQKLLLGRNPYYARRGRAAAFEVHRHAELELSYCLRGRYDMICENKRYTLAEGDLLIIPPMAAHEVPAGNDPACQSLTAVVGYALLGEHFEALLRQNHACRVCRRAELSALMEEIAGHCGDYSSFGELSVRGDLYKVCALLLREGAEEEPPLPGKKMGDIMKIESALGTVYDRYNEPLTVEEVSASCGYSKSNFCKIFKQITGDTFHNTLNRHRIGIACTLLAETDHSVERIAAETGFADLKSFCRVFKKQMGLSAGQYRKKTKER